MKNIIYLFKGHKKLVVFTRENGLKKETTSCMNCGKILDVRLIKEESFYRIPSEIISKPFTVKDRY